MLWEEKRTVGPFGAQSKELPPRAKSYRLELRATACSNSRAMHGSSCPAFPHPKSSAVISVLPAEVLEGINKLIDEKYDLKVHFQQFAF